MDDASLLRSGYDLIYLAACALHGHVPDRAKVSAMELDAVFKMASRHSMSAIACMAIEDCVSAFCADAIGLDEALFKEWKLQKARAMKKIVLFDIERSQLFSFMEAQKIWYMPLKGVVYQSIYPKLGMREMVDNDILFDADFRETIRDYMVDNGYKVKQYGKPTDDNYLKPPVFNFEMHIRLYSEIHGHHWSEYYDSVKDRLVKDTGNSYGYHFSDEDFYVYCTTHAYKHYSQAGNGIRFLMDIYVCLSKLGDKLNWNYIENELEKLNVKEFEKNMRTVAHKIFSEAAIEAQSLSNYLTQAQREVVAYCLGSGTFGNAQNYLDHRMESIAEDGQSTNAVKQKYLLKRIFPDMIYYKNAYPFGYRHKMLIPFCWLHRLFKALLSAPKRLIKELRMVLKHQ